MLIFLIGIGIIGISLLYQATDKKKAQQLFIAALYE